jgi:hypothetical protein
MTPQEKMHATLSKLDLASREIKVYGSQIVVTCTSHDAAIKWGLVLGKFATVKRVANPGLDETKATTLGDTCTIQVWRTWATV